MKILLVSQPHKDTPNYPNHTDHFGGITSIATVMMTELPQSKELFRLERSVFKCLQVRTRANGTNHVNDHDAVVVAEFIKNTSDRTITDLAWLDC
ncbi:hypothetical protein [Aeromonas jandaei]|uniref:hypothetical protein n=1 Tax=Aeromonas jandaei TaxID=650 RepID=UPI0038EC9EE9